MITVQPSTSFETTAQFDTGLTGTLGVRVTDNAGATTIARTTTGIAEYPAGSGIYAKTLTSPAATGQFSLVWDDGTNWATDDLVVTGTAAATVVTTGSDYTDLATVKASLSLTGYTFADADISRQITAASRAVDGICDRRFWIDTSDVTRYYTPTSARYVPIDDLAALTSLATDTSRDGTFATTWVTNTDFTLSPLTGPNRGFPSTGIALTPNSSRYFDVGWPRTIRVAGRFGWPAVPQDISTATEIIAVQLLRRIREAPFGIVAFGVDSASAMRLTRSDPHLNMLLGPYTRLGS